jgi:hypothetical protein
MTRIRVSATEMFERALQTGYLAGKYLRLTPGSHYARWRAFCADNRTACIALSNGHRRARVSVDITTINHRLTFATSAAELLTDLRSNLAYFRRVVGRDDAGHTITLERNALLIDGIALQEGEWLAQRLVDVVAIHYHDLLHLPANVVLLHGRKRMRPAFTTYGGAA